MKKIIILTLFALTACGTTRKGHTNADADMFGNGANPVYFGTWRWANIAGHPYQVMISADTLVFLECWEGKGYTLSELKWKAINDSGRWTTDYPKGYKITGKVEANSFGYTKTGRSKDDVAAVGEQAVDFWYIAADGQSLTQGNADDHAAVPGTPFVKQPAAE